MVVGDRLVSTLNRVAVLAGVFAIFFVVVAILIERVHLALVFALAITVALMLQSGSLWLLNRFQQ